MRHLREVVGVGSSDGQRRRRLPLMSFQEIGSSAKRSVSLTPGCAFRSVAMERAEWPRRPIARGRVGGSAVQHAQRTFGDVPRAAIGIDLREIDENTRIVLGRGDGELHHRVPRELGVRGEWLAVKASMRSSRPFQSS